MRGRIVVVAAVGLSLLAPASAAAQDPQACALGGGPWHYQARLSRPVAPNTTLLHLGVAAAREAVGAQFAGVWFSNRQQGWAVGVAPGSLTVEQARAAIEDALATRVSGEGLDTLTSMLHVHAQLYTWAELEAALADVNSRLSGFSNHWGGGISCPDGDAFRMYVWVWRDPPPEFVAHAQEILAPFGDRVRLVLTDSPPPTLVAAPLVAPAAPGAAPPRLRRLVALPRGCVRGRVASIRARALVRRLTVTAAGKERVGRRVRVPVGKRVRITVLLHDGRTVERAVALRRCA